MERLENEMEYLLSVALRKCGNLQDAEDLVQETMLAAVLYQAGGKHIDRIRPWLVAVLNRKYFDMLRWQYRRPTISIGEDFDIACEPDFPDDLQELDDARRVRRGIAYLLDTYREVMVRHYMEGQAVAEIAAALGIPEGTVKSRLSVGRTHVKKGMDDMEHYESQSYRPIKLLISNSGCSGMNGEPASLVEKDLIAQNLLCLAYEKPVSETELARAIGIPMAYVEPIVDKLVEGELMRRTGNKVYTDFVLYTAQDQEQYIPAQQDFVEKHFQQIWIPIEAFYGALRETAFYQKMGDERREALEWFCFFHILDHSLYRAFSDALEAKQEFPDRPSGGKWIAFGHRIDAGKDIQKQVKYGYAGMNNLWLDNYLGARRMRMSLYYPEGFPVKLFRESEHGISEENLMKLLYIIENGMEIRSCGFDEHYLDSVPWLAECRILHCEGSRPALSVPVLSQGEMEMLETLLGQAQAQLTETLLCPLKEFLKGKKKPIPPHLKSVPLQKQYLYSYHAMLMITLRLALREGLIRDEGYDAGAQTPCPMVLVVDS